MNLFLGIVSIISIIVTLFTVILCVMTYGFDTHVIDKIIEYIKNKLN